MNYRQIQSALKELKAAGADVQVKLNASFDTLEAEYNRLTAIATPVSPEQPQVQPSQQPEQPQVAQIMTADEFNAWVGLPTDAIAEPRVMVEAKAEPEVQTEPEPSLEATEVTSYQPQEVPETSVEVALDALEQAPETSSKVDPVVTPQPTTEQIVVLPLATMTAPAPRQLPGASYWIDGTELGQRLDPTQVQALRNLEDGLDWLGRWHGNLRAFAKGFREGWRQAGKRQIAPDQPKVVPLNHSSPRQPMAVAA